MLQPVIPDPILFNVLLNTNFNNLENLCLTDKRALKYCNDEYFWKTKYYHDELPIIESITNWKRAYKIIYIAMNDINKILAISRIEKKRDSKILIDHPNNGTIVINMYNRKHGDYNLKYISTNVIFQMWQELDIFEKVEGIIINNIYANR